MAKPLKSLNPTAVATVANKLIPSISPRNEQSIQDHKHYRSTLYSIYIYESNVGEESFQEGQEERSIVGTDKDKDKLLKKKKKRIVIAPHYLQL